MEINLTSWAVLEEMIAFSTQRGNVSIHMKNYVANYMCHRGSPTFSANISFF